MDIAICISNWTLIKDLWIVNMAHELPVPPVIVSLVLCSENCFIYFRRIIVLFILILIV
jgi:hypothetical protein